MQNYRTTVVSEKEVKERMHETAKTLGVNISSMLKIAFSEYEASLKKKGVLSDHETR